MVRIEKSRVFPVEPEVGFDWITKPTNWPEFWPDLVDIPDLEQTRWQEPGDTARLRMKLAGRLTELHMTLDELEPAGARSLPLHPAGRARCGARATLRARRRRVQIHAGRRASRHVAASPGSSTAPWFGTGLHALWAERSTTLHGSFPQPPASRPR